MSRKDDTQSVPVPDPLGVFDALEPGTVGPFGVRIPDPGAGGSSLHGDVPEDDGSLPPSEPIPDPPEAPWAPQPGEAVEHGGGPDTRDGDTSEATSNREMPQDDAENGLERAARAGEDYIDRVEQAMDEETCDLCKQILKNLRDYPLPKQVQGVKELAKLKEVADSGADPVEIAEVMGDFEVVDDPGQML